MKRGVNTLTVKKAGMLLGKKARDLDRDGVWLTFSNPPSPFSGLCDNQLVLHAHESNV